MKRLVVIALLLPFVVMAGPLSEPLTVKEFLQVFRPTPEANEPKRTAAEFLGYQKAQGFIDGVKDATDGWLWCHDPEVKAVELDNLIYHRLKEKPQLNNARAGLAISNQLALAYPCKKGKAP